MEKWLVTAKKADFNKWASEFKIDPVVARIIRNRDIVEADQVRAFLRGNREDLYEPALMKDMVKASRVILDKIQAGNLLRVIGDYDVDGVSSASILTKGIRFLGGKVDTVIPHRIKDGYGLNEELIEAAKEAGVDTIVTCDNGIAAASQIELAITLGIVVIVTDHHEVPFVEENGIRQERLPKAEAVVDPKRQECEYPFKEICGGVVAYKLIQQMLIDSGRIGEEAGKELLDELIQYAAIATICDVMPLTQENRIIVKYGLKLIKEQPAVGLRALIEVCGVEPQKLSAYHLGFVLGPCINATGRLDTAQRGLELLDAKSFREAVTIAEELKELNDSRKTMTLSGVKQALTYIEEKHINSDRVLVVFLPDCHESLAGIIAGRVREKYGKPSFVLTKGEEGLKGSGRSIDAYHMYEALCQCKELLGKFGGHKLAAGLSLPEENLERFRIALNENCSLTKEDFIPTIHIDVPMPMEYASLKLVRELEVLEPFGVGNPKPLFAQKDLIFTQGKRLGASGSFGRYQVKDVTGHSFEVVYFGDLEAFHEALDAKYGQASSDKLYRAGGEYTMSVTYQIGINSFRGQEALQFIMQNYC